MRPLDLIMFSNDTVVSEVIEFAQEVSRGLDTVSHVGLVVDSTILKSYEVDGDVVMLVPDTWYIMEAIFDGVTLNTLTDTINKYSRLYNAQIGVCSMIKKHNIKRLDFTNVFEKYYGRKYDFSIIGLTASVFKFMRPLRYIKEHLIRWLNPGYIDPKFCSELCADILSDLNIFIFDNPENVVPVDFLHSSVYNKPVWFLGPPSDLELEEC